MRSENLYGDGAIETRIAGTVHFTHAASSQRADDLVRT